MPKENIEDVSTEVLKKRKKFIVFLLGIFIGVTIVWLALIIYNLVSEGRVEKNNVVGLVPTLACIWIPIMMLGNVNKELKRRKD